MEIFLMCKRNCDSSSVVYLNSNYLFLFTSVGGKQHVNYLFGVSDEKFGVSVDNVGVSGMVAVGVSGGTGSLVALR